MQSQENKKFTKEDFSGRSFAEAIFSLGGKKAYVIPGHWVNGSQEVEICSSKEAKAKEIILGAIKIATYMTVIIPLVMLIGKALFRGTHKFHIVPKSTDIENSVPSSTGVDSKVPSSNGAESILEKLSEIFSCCICFENFDQTTISLRPCTHELHEKCALDVMKTAACACPLCCTPITHYEPALTTRDASNVLFATNNRDIEIGMPSHNRESSLAVAQIEKELNSTVSVVVYAITGGVPWKISINPNKEVAFLAKAISEKERTPVTKLKLLIGGKVADFFKPINSYPYASPNNTAGMAVIAAAIIINREALLNTGRGYHKNSSSESPVITISAIG